jgi:hypothetical protein
MKKRRLQSYVAQKRRLPQSKRRRTPNMKEKLKSQERQKKVV